MWATSIGSTFSQSPVPGERKSGMPLGTEMPAPVSATVLREERISSASRSTPSCPLGIGGRVGERRLVAAAAAHFEMEQLVLDFDQVGVNLAALSVMARDYAGDCRLLLHRAPNPYRDPVA